MQMPHIGRSLNAGGRHFGSRPAQRPSSLSFLFIKSLVIFTDHSDILKVQAAKCYVL